MAKLGVRGFDMPRAGGGCRRGLNLKLARRRERFVVM
jgi:hypothetical protein